MTVSVSLVMTGESYVAFRLALDHPEVVDCVALLDSVPIGEALDRCDERFATEWWHRFFSLSRTSRSAPSMLTRTPGTAARQT